MSRVLAALVALSLSTSALADDVGPQPQAESKALKKARPATYHAGKVLLIAGTAQAALGTAGTYAISRSASNGNASVYMAGPVAFTSANAFMGIGGMIAGGTMMLASKKHEPGVLVSPTHNGLVMAGRF